MIDIEKIYSLYYNDNPKLLKTVLVHSECVMNKALERAREKSLEIDLDFVCEAAMLHDVGVIRCNAPSIYCYGSQPYICHGIEGRQMLDYIGLPRHALVCERHTGSGLSIDDIIRQNLPLPCRDMLPVSTEEKLICYADKFFSKSGDLSEEKPLQKIISQMEAFGSDSLNRFMELHKLFG